MKVIKHSGHVVPFDIEKLKLSLQKSGADPDLIRECLVQIQNQIYEGITTKQIYKLAFAILKKASNGHAARYNLRYALQMLGPAGFSLKNSYQDFMPQKVIKQGQISTCRENVYRMK